MLTRADVGASAIARLAPGYMPMGAKGMGAMAGMGMRLPENTLPMMAGQGRFGSLGMDGIITTLKVRPGLAKGDLRDPGPYRDPPGTVAYEWAGAPPPEPHKARDREG